MDFNSKINWQGGLELTSQLFREMDSNASVHQLMAVRLAVGSGAQGLVPLTEFSCRPAFEGRSLEIAGMKATAVLPSANIITVDEDVRFDVVMPEPGPYRNGTFYYLAVGLSEETVEFETDEIPYTRPRYSYSIMTAEQVGKADIIPLARFRISDGALDIDSDFIPPVLEIGQDARLEDMKTRIVSKLEEMTGSVKVASGKAGLVQSHTIRLKEMTACESLRSFVREINDTVGVIDFLLQVTNETGNESLKEAVEWHSECVFMDLEQYINKCLEFLDAAAKLSDRLEEKPVVEIDTEALKAEIKAELYAQIHPEINELLETTKAELIAHMDEELEARLATALENMKTTLYDMLSERLREELYQPLYDALYRELYNALYVPAPVEEDNFTPLI